MPLVNLRQINLSYGEQPLLEGVDLTIDKGERLCLVGRNGSGKSTLMKLIEGRVQADSGLVEYRQGLRVARMEQEVPEDSDNSIRTLITGGLGETGELLQRFHQLTESQDTDAVEQLTAIQQTLDEKNAWGMAQRVDKVLSQLQLNGELLFSGLSGGMKRRVLLARALVQEPDLLLLDEPTNHLDVAAIEWMEGFLLDYPATLLFISHDRALIRHLATRIIELDRGYLTSWPGNYDRYLDGKAKLLEDEAREQALFNKRLSQEEKWIRQGIKARRTRNEGRVRALKAMRRDYAKRRKVQGKVSLTIQQAESSGKLLIEAKDLSYQYDNQPIVSHLNWTLQRGDRVGIIGPNGCGKSTLLKLLLKQLTPQNGSIRHGNQLQLAYFDQLRDKLNLDASVLDNLAEGSDQVTINGKSKHVIGYLQDFLFSPDRARQPVSALSGGERNRLLLAKVFTRSFNLLVLDEPTNDLDVETLELLEDQLQQYQGSLLLVSHDRAFIESTVTSTLVFENNNWNSYVGGYDDWQRQRRVNESKPPQPVEDNKPKPAKAPERPSKKLTYAERLALDALPNELEALENTVAQLTEQLNDPALYQGDQQAQLAELNQTLEATQQQLEEKFLRWTELEEKAE